VNYDQLWTQSCCWNRLAQFSGPFPLRGFLWRRGINAWPSGSGTPASLPPTRTRKKKV